MAVTPTSTRLPDVASSFSFRNPSQRVDHE
jgi:hypothetical protein